jgi:hypothetical protein
MAAGDPVFSSDFAEVVSAVGITKVKEANQTRTSTTTLLDDAELKDIELAAGRYRIFVMLTMVGGAGGIPIVTRWGFSGTWNAPLRLCKGPTAANTAAGGADPPQQRTAVSATSDATYGLGTSAAYQLITEVSAQIVVTASGLFSVQWRPNSSAVNSGGVNQGSHVIIVPFEQ